MEIHIKNDIKIILRIDHFKIHNSQVPAIYSWEKPSELLFIKEREGSLAKKREKEVVCGNVQGIFRLNK